MENIINFIISGEIFNNFFKNDVILFNFFLDNEFILDFLDIFFIFYPADFDIIFNKINQLEIPILLEKNIDLPINIYFNFIDKDLYSLYDISPLDVLYSQEENKFLLCYDSSDIWNDNYYLFLDFYTSINSFVYTFYIIYIDPLYWVIYSDYESIFDVNMFMSGMSATYFMNFISFYQYSIFINVSFDFLGCNYLIFPELISKIKYDHSILYDIINYKFISINSIFDYLLVLSFFKNFFISFIEYLGFYNNYLMYTYSISDIIYKEYEINNRFYLFCIYFCLFYSFLMMILIIFINKILFNIKYILIIYYNQKINWVSFYLQIILPKNSSLTFFGKTYLTLYNLRFFIQTIIIDNLCPKSFLQFLDKPKNIQITWANLFGFWKYISSWFLVMYWIYVNFSLYFKLKYIIWKKYNIELIYDIILIKNLKKKELVMVNYLIYLVTIQNYILLFLPFFIQKSKKLIYFFFYFFYKFIFYKFIKFIIYFNFINNKFIYIFIYYIYNLLFISKYIVNIFSYKFIVYLYLKCKLNNIFFFNIPFHFYIYKYIVFLFYKKFYYINAELYDHFPLYQSNFAINFLNIIVPLNFKNTKYIYKYIYINIFFYFYKLFNIFLNNIFFILIILLILLFYLKYNNDSLFIFFNYTIFFFYFINFYDYKFYNKFIFNIIQFFFYNNIKVLKNLILYISSILTNIIKFKIFLLNYTLNNLWFFLICLISILLYFLYYNINFNYINLYCFYFIFLYTFYNIIINLIGNNIFNIKFLVNFGYFCCLFFDIFKYFFRKIYSLFWKLVLYFIFYPFIFFLCIFILFNNYSLIYDFFYNLLLEFMVIFYNIFIKIYMILEAYTNLIYLKPSTASSNTLAPWTFPLVDQVYIDRYVINPKKSKWLERWMDSNFHEVPYDIVYKHPRGKLKYYQDHNRDFPLWYVLYWWDEPYYWKVVWHKIYIGRKRIIFFDLSAHYNKLYLIDHFKNRWFYFIIDQFYDVTHLGYPKKFINYYKLHDKFERDDFNLQLNTFINPIKTFLINYKNIITDGKKFYAEITVNLSIFTFITWIQTSMEEVIEDIIKFYKESFTTIGFMIDEIIMLYKYIKNLIRIVYNIIIQILQFILYKILYEVLHYIYFFYFKNISYAYFWVFKFNIYNIILNILSSFLTVIYLTILFNIYDYIYILIPYYIIQNLINLINLLNLFLFEYFIFFTKIFIYEYYLFYIYYLKKYIFFKIIYIKINNIFIYFYIIMYNFLSNWYKLYNFLYWFVDIFFYLFLDILYNLNLSFINKFLYCYTNIEFLFYWFFLKLYFLKDSFYSWYKFPIIEFQNIDKLNKYNLSKWHDYAWDLHDLFLIIRKKKRYYFSDYNDVFNWIKFIEFNSLNIDNIFSSMLELEYIFKFYYSNQIILNCYFFFKTDFWNILWLYFFFILYIYLIIIFSIYNYLYSNPELDILNYSNHYNWEVLREKSIANKFNWFIKHKPLLNHYRAKSKLSTLWKFKGWPWWEEKKVETEEEQKKKTREEIKRDLEKKREAEAIKLYIKLSKKYKKIKKIYFFYYMKYFNFKWKRVKFINKKKKKSINYVITKISKLSKRTIKNFRKFGMCITLFNKLYKIYNRKLHFKFKNLIIAKKFNYLSNLSLIELTRFDFFLRFYYNLDHRIEPILNQFFEEEYFSGPMPIVMFKRDYKYLSNKMYNIYYYSKWIDSIFFFNKGSFYFFHKDPTISYITLNNKYNAYIINSGEEYNMRKFFFCFWFLMIPVTLYFIIMPYLLINFNSEYDKFIMLYPFDINYWLIWLVMQFEYLNITLIKVAFSLLCDIFLNDDIDDVDIIDQFVDRIDSIFADNYSNAFFPLYQYFTIKYFSSEELNLVETTCTLNPWNIWYNIIMHNVYLYFIENIYIFYDILYMKFIKIDTYSSFIIIYNRIRFILFIFLILFIMCNKNDTKLILFYNYIKINFNYYNFSNKITNNFIKLKSKSINKLFKFN